MRASCHPPNSRIESIPTARRLLLIDYRPEYQHGCGSKSFYSHLRLEPLPNENASELLHALLGDDASLRSLTRLLIDRTEGSPFFLDENVHDHAPDLRRSHRERQHPRPPRTLVALVQH